MPPPILPKGAERRIAIIGAAKDMTIQGNLTFTNTNKTENSAMVLGAADQLFLRSTESSANSADYSDSAAQVKINNEGANLAFGSRKDHETCKCFYFNWWESCYRFTG